ncbi:hypothetical protein AB833_01275 [Chromatiales bacterium (ex Bugula neritina AB1)]|nr:hypothetical protein AB833_01275 [Chromatiales bacterium (ex Bugula neritina AB1)]
MAVVIQNSKVLVHKRFRRSRGMVFEFPSGSIDTSKPAEEAAIRELAEQRGIGMYTSQISVNLK